MINCRKYTRYLHKSEVCELKWYEKMLMKYHFFICKLCQKYKIENDWMNQIFLKHKDEFLFSEKEIEQLKQELLKKINI